MEAIQRRIREALSKLQTLSTTARLLIGSLMVTLMMALLLAALYAGQPEMVELPVAVTAENRPELLAFLQSRDIDFEERGTAIMVPVGRQFEVSASLVDHDVLAGDALDFEKLLETESPFLSREQNKQRYLMAKMSMLERTISSMRGIRSANVMISMPDTMMGIGAPNRAASAAVMVLPAGEPLSQGRVDAIARLVSGAQSGLAVENVEVVDAQTGMALQARGDEDYISEDYMEIKEATEKQLRETLSTHFGYIPGLRVSVNAQMEIATVERSSEDYADPKLGLTQEETRNIASSNNSRSMEPGVRSNAGVDISGGGGATSSLTDDRSSAKTVPKFGKTREHQIDPGGYALQVNASITVPRSYFLGVYRQQQGDDSAEPDDTELATLVQSETDRIRADALPLIDTDAKTGAQTGEVQVSMYHDYALAGIGGGIFGGDAAEGTAGGGIGLFSGEGFAGGASGLVKYVALGGLAFLSLAMMFMMVRKATVREELPTAEELVGIPPALMDEDSDLVGEADETPPAMEGFEVEEAALEGQQMLYQVNNLAQESPEEAASLIKKWMHREA